MTTPELVSYDVVPLPGAGTAYALREVGTDDNLFTAKNAPFSLRKDMIRDAGGTIHYKIRKKAPRSTTRVIEDAIGLTVAEISEDVTAHMSSPTTVTFGKGSGWTSSVKHSARYIDFIEGDHVALRMVRKSGMGTGATAYMLEIAQGIDPAFAFTVVFATELARN